MIDSAYALHYKVEDLNRAGFFPDKNGDYRRCWWKHLWWKAKKSLLRKLVIHEIRTVYVCPRCHNELAVYPGVCVPCQNGWKKE